MIGRICTIDPIYRSYMELPVDCCDCDGAVDTQISGAHFEPDQDGGGDGTLYVMFKSGTLLFHRLSCQILHLSSNLAQETTKLAQEILVYLDQKY